MSDEDIVMMDETSDDTKYKISHKLTPYELLVGEFNDDNIRVMNSVYDYNMRKSDEKDFGDEMWIHNCYNSSICMRSFGYPDPDYHMPQPSLTNDDCRNLQEYMNIRAY